MQKAIFLLFLILGTACNDSFFTTEDRVRLEDSVPPEIILKTNRSFIYYAGTVEIKGQVIDRQQTEESPLTGSLYYKVEAYDISGEVPLDEDGMFSFSLDTQNMEGSVPLKLFVFDRNRNRGEKNILLKEQLITSFSCTPENRAVSLSWVVLKDVETVTLYYTDDNSIPSENNRLGKLENPASPLSLPDLENGKRYTFLLKASSGEEKECWSDPIETIPLSGFTLTPEVKGSFRAIDISWPPIPGAEWFSLFKSLSPEGPFVELPSRVKGTHFSDTQIVEGQSYFYSVAPSLAGCRRSFAADGRSFPFREAGTLAATAGCNNSALGLSVSGDIAVLADRSAGIKIFNIADPENPELLKSLQTPGLATGTAINGDKVYIAADGQGLIEVDISSPANPVLGRQFNTTGYAMDVIYHNGYLFVADKTNGIVVIDPLSFTEAGNYVLPGGDMALGLAAKDNTLFAAYRSSGLVVLDITNPTAPAHIATRTTPGYARDIKVDNTFAYIADSDAGLSVFDISSPSTPSLKATASQPGYACAVDLDDFRIWLADDQGKVFLINAKDLSTGTTTLNSHEVFNDADSVKDIVVSKGFAFTACGAEGLKILNAAFPSCSQSLPPYNPTEEVRDAAVRGNYAFLITDALQVLDITDPAAPSPVKKVTLKGAPDRIYVHGPFAFITGNKHISSGEKAGLQILDISIPADPVAVKHLPLSDETLDVFVHGDYAYVSLIGDGSNPSGVTLVDISTPETASAIDTYKTTGTPGSAALRISDNRLYLAAGSNGLEVFDTKVFSSPVKSYNMGDDVCAITFSGEYAYISTGYSGMKITPASDPADILSSFVPEGFSYTYDIAVTGNFAFLAQQLDNVFIIDVSNPKVPEYAGDYGITPFSWESARSFISGRYLLLPMDGDGLRIIDLLQ